MRLQIQGTKILTYNLNCKKRIVANEGGARSSKTYSLCQMWVTRMFKERNTLISVVRKTGPALRATVYKDFLTVLKENNLYDERKHNKSNLTYTIGTNEIEFFSLDDSQKVKGRKRKHLWINEANELDYDDWQQLVMRTTGQIYLDYNPSDMDSWIYDDVLTRPDCKLIKSTYKDNPYLEQSLVDEIEHLQEVDDEYWNVYGLGLRAKSQSIIYSNWELIDEMPEDGEDLFGQDFGYNAPSALVHVKLKDDGIYVDELFYKKHHTNSMLINWYDLTSFPKDKIIYGDGAELQRIEEFKLAGYYMESADKSPGSVKKGIDTLKSHKIYITKRSLNIIKEIKTYKWKMTKDGKQLDEPVKMYDHAMDAMRYAVFSYLGQPYFGFA